MTDLTTEQLAYIKTHVNLNARHYFLAAASTNSDRKFAVVAVLQDNGELATAVVKTDKSPLWMSNQAQFEEVVNDAIRRLSRMFIFG